MSNTKACPTCRGEGLMYEIPGVPHCEACGGCGDVALDGSRLDVLSHGEANSSVKRTYVGEATAKAACRMENEMFKAMLLDPCKKTPAFDDAVANYLETVTKANDTVTTISVTARPSWAQNVTVGDWLTIKEEFMTRGGKSGQVVGTPSAEGVSLDFYCDVSGNPEGLPTIEFWEWGEIDTDLLPAHSQHSTAKLCTHR